MSDARSPEMMVEASKLTEVIPMYARGRVLAVQASDGHVLWEKPVGYRSFTTLHAAIMPTNALCVSAGKTIEVYA